MTTPLQNETGYELWLRYVRIDNSEIREQYRSTIKHVVFPTNTPTLDLARKELQRGLQGLLGLLFVQHMFALIQ